MRIICLVKTPQLNKNEKQFGPLLDCEFIKLWFKKSHLWTASSLAVKKYKNGGFSNWYHQFMSETPMMIAHFCVKKTFLSHLYKNVANHDFDRFHPRKLFVKISSICYQKRKWNIKHKRFIEQSISYHIGWSTLRSKVLKIAFFSYFTIYISKFLLDMYLPSFW